jgi:hypothetical protein
VRAKLVERPEQWPWSSYRGYQQERRALDWVTYRYDFWHNQETHRPGPTGPGYDR